MKKGIFLGLLALLFSCDDGDLSVETIDFDSVDIQTCDPVELNTSVFFKINGSEALILELESGKLLNETSTMDLESTIGSGSQLTYRIFSDAVSNTYFCSDIPATTPTVISEIQAENGTVLITTTGVETDTVTFNHSIRLDDVTFITSSDARITDLTINEFGTVTTTKTE